MTGMLEGAVQRLDRQVELLQRDRAEYARRRGAMSRAELRAYLDELEQVWLPSIATPQQPSRPKLTLIQGRA